ncbi:MAG: CalY family protein [Clostridiales bacterium]|nr:CalY family protein [Clostridiales bacterium]MDD7036215.1 TasA family protein [Bacillota bacterium]MDY2920949.1 TasA family protein [Lentihominibacter sp.]
MKRKAEVKRNVLLAAAVAALLGIGGIFAYFTDTDSAVNTFTVGKVEIDLEEPSWDPDNPPTDITPGDSIDKDPQILNSGRNDAYMFLKVSVPYANVSLAADDGTVQAKADRELFTYTVGSGWTELGNPVKNTSEGTIEHIYAYGGDEMTVVKSGVKTGTLFDTVRFINVIDGEGLEGSVQNILVEAYAIQAANISEESTGKATPAYVWTVLTNRLASGA